MACNLLTTNGLVHVRDSEADEEIRKVGPADIPDLIAVTAASHSKARPSELFERHLRHDHRGYLLTKRGRPAAYTWIARDSFEIYPYRMRLRLAPGLGYFFYQTVAPCFRRKGLLGKLLRTAWEVERLDAACICIPRENDLSHAANQRLGFRPCATVDLRRLGFIRIHSVRRAAETAPLRYLSLCRFGANARSLICEMTDAGLRFAYLANGSSDSPVL